MRPTIRNPLEPEADRRDSKTRQANEQYDDAILLAQILVHEIVEVVEDALRDEDTDASFGNVADASRLAEELRLIADRLKARGEYAEQDFAGVTRWDRGSR